MTEIEITEMLQTIFPPKPEAPETELPECFYRIIEIARSLDLEWIPKIVMEPEPVDFTGRLDLSYYSETTIRIAQKFQPWDMDDPLIINRTEAKMARTLMHELGHCYHLNRWGAHYDNWGWSNCENFADAFRGWIEERM